MLLKRRKSKLSTSQLNSRGVFANAKETMRYEGSLDKG